MSDADVIKCLKMLTFLPLEEIEAMEKWEGSALNKAKEILAFELTQLVHGTEEAQKAKEVATALFAGGVNSENMPTTVLLDEQFIDGGIEKILTRSEHEGLSYSLRVFYTNSHLPALAGVLIRRVAQ